MLADFEGNAGTVDDFPIGRDPGRLLHAPERHANGNTREVVHQSVICLVVVLVESGVSIVSYHCLLRGQSIGVAIYAPNTTEMNLSDFRAVMPFAIGDTECGRWPVDGNLAGGLYVGRDALSRAMARFLDEAKEIASQAGDDP